MRKIGVMLASVALAVGHSFSGPTQDPPTPCARRKPRHDLVEGIANTLNTPTPDGAIPMNNTYIFFTSDNGFHHGEHRIPKQKWRPYEEAIHMPLVVRGPGIAAGSTTYKLTLNTDYPPTSTDLAGAQTPPYVDGRSLRPVLDGSLTTRQPA
jgi:N-acetylglucosamine-6-sulfatase